MHKWFFFFIFQVVCTASFALPQELAETPKVSCTIRGQLGNQMFIVAACVAYALDHGYEPIFPELKEARGSHLNIKHIFHRLNLEGNTKGFVEWKQKNHNALIGIYKPIPFYLNNPNIILTSFFQSEKYFKKHSEVIHELFLPDKELEEAIRKKYANELNQPITVGMHIRTFNPNPKRDATGDRWQGWGFFKRAMNRFPKNALFIICSDNPTFVEKHFPIKNRKTVLIQGNNHIWDLYLLSFCDHQIVSPRSSYSWWAAWLNDNPNKVVVAAKYNGWGIKQGRDLIPDAWTTIPK